jgi:hypothetical protein
MLEVVLLLNAGEAAVEDLALVMVAALVVLILVVSLQAQH